MSRSYVCDAPDCGLVLDDPPIEVTYEVETDSDDEATFTETHFCGFTCLAAWSTGVALDFPVQT